MSSEFCWRKVSIRDVNGGESQKNAITKSGRKSWAFSSYMGLPWMENGQDSVKAPLFGRRNMLTVWCMIDKVSTVIALVTLIAFRFLN